MRKIVDYNENKAEKLAESQAFTELENEIEAAREAYQDIPVPEEMRRRMEEAIRRAKRERRAKIPVIVAAAVALLIILPNTGADVAYAMGNIPVVGKLFQAVTFRDYQYESERFDANVEVPQIIVEDIGGKEDVISGNEAGAQEEGQEHGDGTANGLDTLQQTVEQVNFDIEEVTNQLIEEFQRSADLGESYGSLEIHHETVTDNERYFTLKLSIYQGAGSGSESYKLYTIGKQSGQRVQIGDLFREGSGYHELISENIREQMRTAMAEDEMKVYWVDYEEVPEWNWQGLKDDQNFYFDHAGNLVVVFDEYEIAPGYMGAQEFTVDRSVFEGLLK